jgi:magnesium chelatase family protein
MDYRDNSPGLGVSVANRGAAAERSHFDLPLALGLLVAVGAADAEAVSHFVAVGELGLDGRIAASPGVLLAALHASQREMGLICPAAQGADAAWAGNVELIAARLIPRSKASALRPPPSPGSRPCPALFG